MLVSPGRAAASALVAPSASQLSPGRAFTRTIVGRFESEHAAHIRQRLSRIYREIMGLQWAGLHHDAAQLLDRVANIEWEEAIRFGARLGTSEAYGNLLLNEGWDADCWDLILGNAGQAYNNANARTGVGDSSTAASASQTDLQAATNKTYKAMVASYPAKGGAGTRRADFRSDYVSGDANYAWQEFIVDNNEGTPTNMLRVVSAQGTKASGQTWTLTIQVTMT